MKVLIIDDDAEIVEATSLCFRLRWPDVTILSTGEAGRGLQLVEAESPDAVIMDLSLPDMDGMEVLHQLRLFSDVPAIILSARDQKMDLIRSLEAGADDYIIKPFDHIEFLARVKAVLRRAGIAQLKESIKPFQSGNLRIDFSTREVRLDGKLVKLTPIEYNLLQCLAQNAGHIVPHRVLLEKVWGEEYTSATDYLKAYIQRLRAKFREHPSTAEFIVTEWKVGYKLVKFN